MNIKALSNNLYVIRFFPAHLLQLHGQYGYDYSMDEYNGVRFIYLSMC